MGALLRNALLMPSVNWCPMRNSRLAFLLCPSALWERTLLTCRAGRGAATHWRMPFLASSGVHTLVWQTRMTGYVPPHFGCAGVYVTRIFNLMEPILKRTLPLAFVAHL